ncbi:MAG: branched-chain amino acid aminotransferase [Candidatus Izemoplasmatales bacterium]|jgi:branched-chain amino acid aminotransferase|nr:branched-chain amino acid aminotransferase [bacterium]MDZ4197377.1 branched-chain amino acid aminotransferase [Candidatus Izemoplasmatales bacterium]
MIKQPTPLIDFTNLTYHYVRTNVNYVSYYKDGLWDEGQLQAEDSLRINILSTTFHYGQQAFEGMKAYRTKEGKIQLFRPYENAVRFQKSCQRIMMPPVSVEQFMDAVIRVVEQNSEFVPPYETQATLYIRPYMIGVGPNLVLAPSKEYIFGVVVMPVGLFFKSGLTPADFLVSEFDRAAPHGTGAVKIGGNYAASMYPNYIAKSQGFTDCIYLDPATHTRIDEGGAANFFAIRKDGVFVSPKSSSILPSITKLSLLDIAKNYLHLEVLETEIYIEDLTLFDEAATCGTAAIITPIGSLTHHDTVYHFGTKGQVGHVTKRLYEVLTGIQFGDITPPHNWILSIE